MNKLQAKKVALTNEIKILEKHKNQLILDINDLQQSVSFILLSDMNNSLIFSLKGFKTNAIMSPVW